MPANDRRPYFWMLGSAAAFTGMGALARGLQGQVPWAATALFRTLVAFALAAALTWFSGGRFAVLRPATLWLRSLCGSCSLLFTFHALQKLPLATTLTLTHMAPLWIALLSKPLLGHGPGRGALLAAAVGVAGLALVNRPDAVPDPLAAWGAVAASLFTAFAMIGLHLVKNLDASAVVTHFSAVGSVFAVAACLAGDHGHLPAVPSDPLLLATLLGVGGFATLGQLLMTKAYAAAEPARVAVVGLSQTAMALAVDMAWWGVRPDGLTFLGMALVIAPTAWAMTRRKPPTAVAPGAPP